EAAGAPLPGPDVGGLAALVLASRAPGLGGRPACLANQRRAHDALVALGPGRLRLLALLRPSLVTSAPSAPVGARVSASRVLVAADLDRLLRAQGALPPGAARAAVVRQVTQRREWLDGSVVLRGPDGRERRHRHQLLSFDPRGDGQVVELVGDAASARHLGVLVPGTGSDLRRYPGTLARASAFAAADPSVAMVVWQGSDFPDQPFDDGVLPLREHVVAAAYRDAADAAGPRLAADVEGMRLSVPAAADLTVLGHSYGAAVVGSAEAHGMVADRVVHVAGAGTYLPPAAGTATGADGALSPHVVRHLSMTAYDDPIRLAQGHDLDDASARWRAMTPPPVAAAAPVAGAVLPHLAGDPHQVGLGPDPDLFPGVVRLDVGVHDDGRPVSGHSAMWTPGSTAWRNLLAVVQGRPVEVLEPSRWSSHLEPAHVRLDPDGVHLVPPRYVVDRSPWDDPGYRPPVSSP
ncbi:alpha/beta hydrolase, partial [Angustibacter peucedani]